MCVTNLSQYQQLCPFEKISLDLIYGNSHITYHKSDSYFLLNLVIIQIHESFKHSGHVFQVISHIS